MNVALYLKESIERHISLNWRPYGWGKCAARGQRGNSE